MKFFYFLLTFFFFCLTGFAQASTPFLNSEQKNSLQTLGAQAIQEVLNELNLDLSNTEDLESITSVFISSQITSETTPNEISETVTVLTLALINRASLDPNVDLLSAISTISSASMQTTILLASEYNMPTIEIIKATSDGSMTGTLSSLQTLAEDINGDGVVDKRDYVDLILAASSGSFSGAMASASLAGDVNNNGEVDKNDFSKILEATTAGISEGAIQAADNLAIDVNYDGKIDARDLKAVTNAVTKSVISNTINSVISNAADMNNDGVLDKKDLNQALDDTFKAMASPLFANIIASPSITISTLEDISLGLILSMISELNESEEAIDSDPLVEMIQETLMAVTDDMKPGLAKIPQMEISVHDSTLISPARARR